MPVVTGSLSFRIIGESAYPTISRYANVDTDRGSRYIVCCQRRPQNDALLASLATYVGYETDLTFILCGIAPAPTVGEGRHLGGTIYILLPLRDRRSRKKADLLKRVLSADIDTLRKAQSEDAAREAYDACAVHVLALFSSSDEDLACLAVDFRLDRNGLAGFDKPKASRADLLGDQGRPQADSTRPQAVGVADWVAQQAYFFLRDVSHVHQHHNRETDTILWLENTNDPDWRVRILRSLYASIGYHRRSQSRYGLIRAQGLLAYAQAFRRICHQAAGAAALKRSSINDRALSASIATALAEHEYLDTDRASRRSTWVATTAFLVGTIIAILAILVQPRINPNERQNFPLLYYFSDLATLNFGSIVSVIVLTVAAYRIWRIRDLDRHGRRFMKVKFISMTSVRRLAAAYPGFAAAALVSVGSAAIVATTLLFFQLFKPGESPVELKIRPVTVPAPVLLQPPIPSR